MNARNPNCGVCGALKVERRGRLECQPCARRHAKTRRERVGPPRPTEASRAVKARYRNKVRPTGLTNGQVYALRKRFGISEALYLKIRQKHRDRCGVCQADITVDPVLDHDHVTDRIRGLLCRSCNLALGLMRDDPERLRAAAQYIECGGVIGKRRCDEVREVPHADPQ